MGDLLKQAEDYQYIRFVCADFNGLARGKVCTSLAKDQLESGMAVYGGAIAMGPASQVPFALEKEDERCGENGYLIPAVDKIYPVPWATNGKYAVGEVLCDMTFADGSPMTAVPRTLVQKQLAELSTHGLKLYSAFEVECLILSKDTYKPLVSKHPSLSMIPLSIHEELLYDMDQKFQETGIHIENIHCEYTPGQFEFSFVPSWGIDCSDMLFRLKGGMKEMCLQKDLHCTFMSRPYDVGLCNGAHFNFSLWTEDGQNAFYDATKPDKLSDTCLYFIGGILEHLPALTVLCSSTANCYRRIHQLACPTQADWDIENRAVALRVKNFDEKRTYVECRLPSGSSNSYLVTAGILAAGLDGIKKKTSPPPKGKGDKPGSLPHTLDEGLKALQSDELITEALGEMFMKWFVSTKFNFEVLKFGNHDMKNATDEELALERDEYFEYF